MNMTSRSNNNDNNNSESKQQQQKHALNNNKMRSYMFSLTDINQCTRNFVFYLPRIDSSCSTLYSEIKPNQDKVKEDIDNDEQQQKIHMEYRKYNISKN